MDALDPKPLQPVDWVAKNDSKYLEWKFKLMATHRIEIPFKEVTNSEAGALRKYRVNREVWTCQKTFHNWGKRIGRKIETKFNKDTMILVVEIVD